METEILNIGIFDVLDWIRKDHSITEKQWALASGLKYQARVGELRMISRVTKRNPGQDTNKIYRRFTIEKLVPLIGGLKELIDPEALSRDLLSNIGTLENPKSRMLLLILFIDEKFKLGVVENVVRSMINGKE